MKPVCRCKVCGNQRPGVCNQTVFGLNLEIKDNKTVVHGELRKGPVK